jgi:bifunctional DNase/RNase
MIRVSVARLGLDSQSNSFVVVLHELEGERFLPIWIGRTEAESIAAHLQGVKRERPMTHDLFRSTLAILGVTLDRVEITRVEASTFFALLQLRRGDERWVVDARPSDAIALVVRADAPLFVADELLLAPEASDDEDASAFLLDDAPPFHAVSDQPPQTPAESLQQYLSSLRPEDFGKFRP